MPNSILNPAITLLDVHNSVASGGVSAAANDAAHAPQVVSAPVDRATLSPLGGRLNAATQSASALSSFRPALVTQLKAAVSAGTYTPDLGQVALRITPAIRGAAIRGYSQ